MAGVDICVSLLRRSGLSRGLEPRAVGQAPRLQLLRGRHIIVPPDVLEDQPLVLVGERSRDVRIDPLWARERNQRAQLSATLGAAGTYCAATPNTKRNARREVGRAKEDGGVLYG